MHDCWVMRLAQYSQRAGYQGVGVMRIGIEEFFEPILGDETWNLSFVLFAAVLLAAASYPCAVNGQQTNASIRLSEAWVTGDEQIIGNVRDIRATASSVFLTDAQSSTVWKYAADGTFLTSTGRSGQGPGEYGPRITGIAVEGDTVYVSDSSNRRVQVYTRDLEYLRQVRMPAGVPPLREIVSDGGQSLYGAGAGLSDSDWLVEDVLRSSSRQIVPLQHVHGDLVYDRFNMDVDPKTGRVAVAYILKDTLEVIEPGGKHVSFPMIQDHAHDAPPPVVQATDLTALKERDMPRSKDFVSFDVAFDRDGRIWVLAGEYTDAPRRTFYVYTPDGTLVSKVVASRGIGKFSIHGDALYASTHSETRITKYRIVD